MPRKNASSLSASTVSSRRKPWVDPDDAPELNDDFFDRAEIRHGDTIIRPGRPPLDLQPKSAVTLRLDDDVIESYRGTGAGWEARLNADLRKVRKLGAVTPSRKAG